MANLSNIYPFFIVDSLQASVSFYVEKLGFGIQYMGPEDDPFFAMVGRENVAVMLKAIAPGIKPVPNHTRHEWARWDAFVYTADPDTLFGEFQAKGIVFHQPLGDDGNGLRGFEIADADGYVLFFGRPNADQP
jgi:catechol 2,3-dioxygenase-like lactoylglutathione lyase family enzyme